MWAQPEIDLPKQVVEHAKEAAFSGVLPTRGGGSSNSTGPPGMMGPSLKLARVTGPMGGGGGGGGEGGGGPMVVGGAGAGSLQLPHRQQQQMQIQQGGPPFDAPPGFLFEIESQVLTGVECCSVE